MKTSLCAFLDDQQSKRGQQQQSSPPPHKKFGNEGVFWGDLLVEILTRLPVKHLLRLRCVCKSWCALIDDVNFIKRHYQLRHSKCKADKDISIISFGEPADDLGNLNLFVYLLSKQTGDVPLNLTADLARDSAASFINAPELFDQGLLVGIANGIVCFLWDHQNLGLWNPATREFKAISPWQNRNQYDWAIDLVGIGFDCISNDLKILRGIYRGGLPLSHELYSLTTNSWKMLTEVSPLVRTFCNRPFMQAYLNGVCYWSYDHFGTPTILSFNFRTEVFEVFNLPQNAIGSKIGYKYSWKITLYKEGLAFVVTCTNLAKAVCSFDVWVATEFIGDSGTPGSWQHVLTIGTFPWSDDLRLAAFRMDGDMLFVNNPQNDVDESVIYNPLTSTFRNLGVFLTLSFSYVESLFPLSCG